MSRLRRPFLVGRIFFITNNVLRTHPRLTDADFEVLAQAIEGVRARRHFLLTGYVFMPDHWHALFYPGENDTLPRLMNSLKVASVQRINRLRGTTGQFWQARYFDRAIRTVKEYHETIEYVHLNPVRKGMVRRPEDWPWSSIHSYGGPGPVPLEIDRVDLPAGERTRL
jgi:putative transposase